MTQLLPTKNLKFITGREDLDYYIQYVSSPLFSGSPQYHAVIVSFIVILSLS